jgi:hypothetical protein
MDRRWRKPRLVLRADAEVGPGSGIRMDSAEPADRVRALTTAAEGIYKKIHDARRNEYPEPKGLERDRDTFRSLLRWPEPESYVAVVPRGCMSGEGENSPPTWGITSSDSEHKSREDTTFVPESVGALVVRPGWSSNYFHWMFQVLPRLSMLRESGIAIDKYVINARQGSFQNETLAALDLAEETIIEVEPHFHMTARQLAVPSLPVTISAWVCTFLRDAFLPSDSARGKDRIYVSRGTATRGRGITNEEQVKEVLAKFGFREFVPDQCSVAEQVEVFASAGCVVGAHGAGLTNLVFCRPETRVIEFFAPHYVHPVYWMISGQCRLDYYYLVGRGERSESWSTWPDDNNQAAYDAAVEPIEIDQDDLVKLLAMAGL